MSTQKSWSNLAVEFKPPLTGGLNNGQCPEALSQQGSPGWKQVNAVRPAPTPAMTMVFKRSQ